MNLRANVNGERVKIQKYDYILRYQKEISLHGVSFKWGDEQ